MTWNHQKRRNLQSGSALLQVLIGSAILMLMLYGALQQALVLRRETASSGSILTIHLALESFADYVTVGLKQRWCFSESLLRDTACDLTHPRSVERILMNADTEAAILQMKDAGTFSSPLGSPLRLESMEIKASASVFSPSHPMFLIASQFKSTKVDAVRVLIERDNSSFLPRAGREVYLRMTVEMLDVGGAVIRNGSKLMRLVSQISVYPREVGTFALLVANDLHLDRAFNASAAAGDSNIHMYPDRSDASGPGLIFESPVFVNGDVYLPPNLSVASRGYSPVTFSAPITLGSGIVRVAGQPFLPTNAGAVGAQTWNSLKQFGGFLQGVQIDGGRDAGLDYLSGTLAGAIPNNALMLKCIDRNLHASDLSLTSNSKLGAKSLGVTRTANVDLYKYRIAFTEKNRFNAQSVATKLQSAQGDMTAAPSLVSIGPDIHGGAIGKLSLYVGGSSVEAIVSDNMKLTLSPQLLPPNAVSIAQGQKGAAADSVVKAQNELSAAQAALAALTGNPASSTLTAARDRVHDAETTLNETTTNLNNATATLSSLNNLLTQPPSVSAAIKPVIYNGKPQADVIDIEIEVRNAASLRSANGSPVEPSVYFEGFDVGYYKGQDLRAGAGRGAEYRNNGYLNFQNTGGVLNAPLGIASAKSGGGGAEATIPAPEDDGNLNENCNKTGLGGNAFGTTDWMTSFASAARHSWNFANPTTGRFVLDGNNAAGANAVFHVRSIVETCEIASSATIVAGFFTCDHLVISPRSTPLRIIASVITSNMAIDPSAFKAGIRWSTIYHPMATIELRAAGLLKPLTGTCDAIPAEPIWHPYPSIVKLANLFKCNAISLRATADPFTWTAVDPDCGLIAGQPSTTCKKQLLNFQLVEQNREAGSP